MTILTIRLHETLLEAAGCFAKDLREGGVGEDQIEAMVQAFYIGAAQSYIMIEQAADMDEKTFNNAIQQLYEEIDAVMTGGLMSSKAAGNA